MNRWETLSSLYINHNLKIIPILPNSKIPAISAWNKECSSDVMQILYWYENDHNMNFGLPCKENNLFVLDLDVHNENGVENFFRLLNDLDIITKTLVQTTPSGGMHFIYKSDDDLKNVNGVANAFKDYPGIDIRNSNYIVVEPSIINDKPYKFIDIQEPQEMPKKLKEYILNNVGTKEDKKNTPYVKPKEVFEGNRDTSLFEYINNLYYKTRLDYDEILLLANNFNDTIFDEPLEEKVVEYKVNKAFEKGNRGEYLILHIGEDNESHQ